MKLRLKNLATLNVDCTFYDERPFIALENVESWTGSLVQGVELPMRALPQAGMAVVEPGDVLFGKLRPYLAKSWVADRPALASTELMCMRPRTGTDSRWLGYLVLTSPFVDWAVATSEGTRMPRTSWEKIGEYRTTSLSLAEQRAIADYLDIETARIDTIISKKYCLIELLYERIDSLVFAGISGNLTSSTVSARHSRIKWLGNIPNHYGTPWLGAFHTTELGKMLNVEAASGPEQYPYIKNTNVRWDHFDLEDLPTMTFDASDRQRCELRIGDVLVCEGGEVGRSAVWNNDRQIFFQKALHRIRPLEKNVPRFLMYCLWAAAKMDVFSVEGNQATIVHLTGEKLREHRFPWPPLEEQEQIVALIDTERSRIDKIIRGLQEQIELLSERRQALITAAVSGQMVMASSTRQQH